MVINGVSFHSVFISSKITFSTIRHSIRFALNSIFSIHFLAFGGAEASTLNPFFCMVVRVMIIPRIAYVRTHIRARFTFRWYFKNVVVIQPERLSFL